MTDAAGPLYERLLVVRCQTGEPASLAEVIGRYSSRLRFYLRKMTDDLVADDLLQDVWMDVFAKISRLNEPAAFGGWIYRIARDRAYRHLRTRRAFVAPADDETFVDREYEEPPWSAEDVARVRVALDRLPVAQREVLVLQFVEEMSYEQIAVIVNCPIGTVRSRIHHAKRALRIEMERGSKSKEVRP